MEVLTLSGPRTAPKPRQPSLGLAEGEVSRAEFDRVFKAWIQRQAKLEEELEQMFGVLSKWLALGVATCDQLQRYNNKVLGVYTFNQQIRKLMIEAGLEGVPPAPRPRLFGDSAISEVDSGIETLQVNLECDGDGFADSTVQGNICPRRKVIGPPTAPEEPETTNGLGAPLPPAIGWAIVLLATGGLSLLGAKAWEVFQRGMPSNVFNRMRQESRERRLQQDLKRLAAADSCYERELRNLDQDQRGDLELLRQLKEQCDKRAKELVPDRPPPNFERPSGPLKIAKAIAIGGVAIAGTVLIWRFAKKDSGDGGGKKKESRKVRKEREEREAAQNRRRIIAASGDACAHHKGRKFINCINRQLETRST